MPLSLIPIFTQCPDASLEPVALLLPALVNTRLIFVLSSTTLQDLINRSPLSDWNTGVNCIIA